MRTIKNIFLSLFAILTLASCNEKEFLKETPLDFYSPENSMETTQHFQTAMNYLYDRVRYSFMGASDDVKMVMYYATDFATTGLDTGDNLTKLNDYNNTMQPTWSIVRAVWQMYYTNITNANVIIDRVPESQSLTEEDGNHFRAEALFFRAYSYSVLADLFGGVPLVLEEVKAPRRDYVRAKREEVYKQAEADLIEAIKYLDDIENVKDGKVNKQVAQHLLSKICNSYGNYSGAVEAATAVITHPTMALMTQRFGTYASQPGDVYSDLFREGNYNRASGNTESLFVFQYDYLSAGSSYVWNMPRLFIPFYQNLKITATDDSGNEVTTTAFEGITDKKLGRGIGWARPTPFFFGKLWESDFDNDMRNSEYSILRDAKIDNPNSPAFGKWLVKDGYLAEVDTLRSWYPLIKKFGSTTFPEDFYLRDSNGTPKVTAFGEQLLMDNASGTYMDGYIYRLAETYLLRAEAYIGLGDQANAAADINVVRERANAKPVAAGEVDIDYLLDERMRELYGEEFRTPLLCRMGKNYDRTKKYNQFSGRSIQEHHNLWPIPYSEIEGNIYSELSQNPGY